MKITDERFIPGGGDKRVSEDHIERYIFVKPLVMNKVVLDIACGVGYGTKMVSDFGAKSVTGQDISGEAISYAKKNYKAKNIAYFQGNASNIDFADNFFDMVISFETIEHLRDSDRRQFLKEAQRVLKFGGLFILSTPNRNIVSRKKKIPINKYHELEYSKKELVKLLEDSGFTVQSIMGQRIINKLLINIFMMKVIYLTEKIMKKNFGIYDIANGSKITKIPIWCEPRYFFTISRKKYDQIFK